MTPERKSEHAQTRRRALILLAVYALFVALPAAHLLLHDHAEGPRTPIGPSGPAFLLAACGHACDHPFHHHDAHAVDETCAVCQTLGSAKGLPQLAAPALVSPISLGRLASADHELRKAPAIRVPLARGPPTAPTPRFESIVA